MWDPPPAKFEKIDYLKKSKRQRTTSFILFGVGITSTIRGATDGKKHSFGPALTGSGWLVAGGVIATIVAIPLFSSSVKNKKRAASLSFMLQQIPTTQFANPNDQNVFSFSIKTGL